MPYFDCDLNYEYIFKTMINEENIQDGADEPQTQKPSKMNMKQLQKIQNNRYLNQNIYQLFVRGRLSDCLSLIQKCKPDEYKLYMKSLIFKHQYKLQKSLQLLTECEVINKLNFTYLKGIAKNFYLLGKYKSSLEVAKQAYKLNTSDYQIFYIMAKISLAMKDTEGAITSLNRAIAKQPNQQSYLMLASLLLEKGSLEEAAGQLKKALNISPENEEIYEMLGQIYGKLGHKEESLKYFQSSIERNPNRYQSLFSLAAIKQAQDEIDGAFQKYSNAYKVTQNSAAFWNNLAGIMLSKKKQIAAYCCLKKALFLDPFRWDIQANLGLILMKVKKFVGAQMHLRSALKLKKDPYLYNLLSICLTQLGDYANAQKCLQEILKQSSHPQYKINMMCLLLKKGEKQKCRSIIKQINVSLLSSTQKQKFDQISKLL